MNFPVQPVALLDTGNLQRTRHRIEPGMQNRAIPLAGAVQNIRIAFDQHTTQPGQNELPENRAANNARTNNGGIVDIPTITCLLRHFPPRGQGVI
jgi:hypothetical protein